MKKLLITSLVVTGLLLSSSVVVQACSKDKGKCSKCAEKTQKCKITKLKKKVKPLWIHKDSLGITEDQLNKIKDIKHKAIKKMIQLHADKDIVMIDLDSAMRAESINVNVVNKLIDSKYVSKKKTAKTYVKAISDIQKVLTEGQRAQWKKMALKEKFGRSKCSKCANSSGDKICPITGKLFSESGSSCPKCAAFLKDKFCPITGKPLGNKGSSKGSTK